MMNDSGSCIFCSSDAASLRWWRQTAVLSLLCHSLVIVDHRLLSHRWTLIKFNSRSLIRVHLFCQCCVILSWLSCCKFVQWFCPPAVPDVFDGCLFDREFCHQTTTIDDIAWCIFDRMGWWTPSELPSNRTAGTSEESLLI